MRRLFKQLVFVVPFLLASVACEPDTEIFSQIPSEVVTGSDDATLIEVLKKGAYSSIIGTWGGHNSLWSMHEVASDEMVIAQKGADWEDGGQWIRTHRHEYLPSEQAVNNGWTYCYGAIANINLLLLQYGTLEALTAELKVLRALVYLWLIDAYGNVPIIEEGSTDATPPTNSRAEVFAFIEQSINENYALLPEGPTYGTVNRDVANAILAKLYLNAEIYTGTPQWDRALQYSDSVIEKGNYSLASNFFANFTSNNAGSSENIFVIPYDENNAQGFNLPQMTLHYASQATFDLQEQPWNGYASLEEFYNLFDESDDRINSFLVGPQFASDGTRLEDLSAEPTDPDGPPLTFTPFITELAPNGLRQEGARVGKWEYASGAGSSLSNDFPIFRLGDFYLMRAEANWRLGNSAAALADVNTIRSRANVAPLSSLDPETLLAERGREMFAEGYRRSDLIRFGKYNDAWWEKPASTPDKNLFPIPQQQRDANPELVQNPGY